MYKRANFKQDDVNDTLKWTRETAVYRLQRSCHN